jgi:hypothetical protein
MPRVRPAVWIWTVILLGYFTWSEALSFHSYMQAPAPVGPWAKLHREMRTHPGKKVIFFYIGYAGQDFEYEVRGDRSVVVATMRGTRMASGGDNHLDRDYVAAMIEKTKSETSCYYYWIQGTGGVFSDTFLPAMARLGYSEQPKIGEIRVFCRPQ